MRDEVRDVAKYGRWIGRNPFGGPITHQLDVLGNIPFYLFSGYWPMDFHALVKSIADVLKDFDSQRPVHKSFQSGIGPFGEPQIVGEIAKRLTAKGTPSRTKRTPDLALEEGWAIEFKIVRPFGDNGKEAENWSVNLLHPYAGNVSLIGDAIKLAGLKEYPRRGLFIIGFEHDPARINLDPLIHAFELITRQVMKLDLGERVEEQRPHLVHPEHQVLRCIGWELR
jgi:hypothetical protein